MKKLFSVSYSPLLFDITILLLRVAVGATMIHHGYGKLTGFSEMQDKFMNFMGLGTTVSLALTVFAEFFCSIFVLIGFMTRLSLIPCIITMAVAAFMAHEFDIFGKGELAFLYMIVYIALLLSGPGSYSIDGMINKK